MGSSHNSHLPIKKMKRREKKQSRSLHNANEYNISQPSFATAIAHIVDVVFIRGRDKMCSALSINSLLDWGFY